MVNSQCVFIAKLAKSQCQPCHGVSPHLSWFQSSWEIPKKNPAERPVFFTFFNIFDIFFYCPTLFFPTFSPVLTRFFTTFSQFSTIFPGIFTLFLNFCPRFFRQVQQRLDLGRAPRLLGHRGRRSLRQRREGGRCRAWDFPSDFRVTLMGDLMVIFMGNLWW